MKFLLVCMSSLAAISLIGGVPAGSKTMHPVTKCTNLQFPDNDCSCLMTLWADYYYNCTRFSFAKLIIATWLIYFVLCIQLVCNYKIS